MLVTCCECGKKISETANVCPCCGFTGFIDTNDEWHGAAYYSPEMTKRREENREAMWFGFVICVIGLVILGIVTGIIVGIVHLFQNLFQ